MLLVHYLLPPTSRWEVCLVHYAPSAGILLGTKWMLNKLELMTDWRAQEKNQVGSRGKTSPKEGVLPKGTTIQVCM